MYIIPSISPVIETEKVNQIMDSIHKANNILITTHLSPDGDAIGSSLALYHFIKNKGKKVKLVVPNSFPYFLKWMDGINEIEIFDYNPLAGQNIIKNSDLIFSLDYNITKRVGDMGPFIEEILKDPKKGAETLKGLQELSKMFPNNN